MTDSRLKIRIFILCIVYVVSVTKVILTGLLRHSYYRLGYARNLLIVTLTDVSDSMNRVANFIRKPMFAVVSGRRADVVISLPTVRRIVIFKLVAMVRIVI